MQLALVKSWPSFLFPLHVNSFLHWMSTGNVFFTFLFLMKALCERSVRSFGGHFAWFPIDKKVVTRKKMAQVVYKLESVNQLLLKHNSVIEANSSPLVKDRQTVPRRKLAVRPNDGIWPAPSLAFSLLLDIGFFGSELLTNVRWIAI